MSGNGGEGEWEGREGGGGGTIWKSLAQRGILNSCFNLTIGKEPQLFKRFTKLFTKLLFFDISDIFL